MFPTQPGNVKPRVACRTRAEIGFAGPHAPNHL